MWVSIISGIALVVFMFSGKPELALAASVALATSLAP